MQNKIQKIEEPEIYINNTFNKATKKRKTTISVTRKKATSSRKKTTKAKKTKPRRKTRRKK